MNVRTCWWERKCRPIRPWKIQWFMKYADYNSEITPKIANTPVPYQIDMINLMLPYFWSYLWKVEGTTYPTNQLIIKRATWMSPSCEGTVASHLLSMSVLDIPLGWVLLELDRYFSEGHAGPNDLCLSRISTFRPRDWFIRDQGPR